LNKKKALTKNKFDRYIQGESLKCKNLFVSIARENANPTIEDKDIVGGRLFCTLCNHRIFADSHFKNSKHREMDTGGPEEQSLEMKWKDDRGFATFSVNSIQGDQYFDFENV